MASGVGIFLLLFIFYFDYSLFTIANNLRIQKKVVRRLVSALFCFLSVEIFF